MIAVISWIPSWAQPAPSPQNENSGLNAVDSIRSEDEGNRSGPGASRLSESHRKYGQDPQLPPDSEPENLNTLNSPGADYAPFVVENGKYIIFQSERPGRTEGHGLWYSFNRNFRDRAGPVEYSVPLELRFPYQDVDPSDTMKILFSSTDGYFAPSSDDFDGHPCILYRDGRPVEIYLTSRRQVDGQGKLTRDGFQGTNIYYARYRNNQWSEVRHLNELNSDFNDRMAFVTPDGTRMYFVSDRPGGYGGNDIYFSERDLKTGLWSAPVNLGPTINSRYDEITPHISYGGSRLVFASNRPGGIGHFDLYFSRFSGYEWQQPENLGRPINSERDDEALVLTSDGLWTYFASDRKHPKAMGGFDLYRFATPTNLLDSVKILLTGKVLDASSKLPLGLDATIKIQFEEQTIVTSSRRTVKTDGMTVSNQFEVELYSGRVYRVVVSAPGYEPAEMQLDYRGSIPPGRMDDRIVYLEPVRIDVNNPDKEGRIIPGIVVDADTGLALPASRIRKFAGTDVTEVPEVDGKGEFSISAKPGEAFELEASSPGYVMKRQRFQEEGLEKIRIELKSDGTDPCQNLEPACVDNVRILFALNQSTVRPTELGKLRNIARVMQKHPEMKVEVQGHTDRTYRGPEDRAYEYNLMLSRERARAVKQALVEMGISADRLSVKGYSYLRPIVKAEDAVKGAVNRRVEFRRIRE
ncbi:MAG: PD40 domain-containing protein [Leptospiraceae bacterium]|nr:PD40 domain-containing protein [Leptospiraceae bacterium]